MTKIDVLDHGYVRFVDKLGDDLSVVNAARVSFDKESAEFGDNDARLLNYLWKNGHTSPFRHAALTFEVYAPLMVARQWLKHIVASSHQDEQFGWNESSRRYVTEEPTFYIPDPFLSAPENKKQGAGDKLVSQAMIDWSKTLEDHYESGLFLYEQAMSDGMAPEQARLFLPAYGMYVRWRWTASLQSVMHFATLRLGHEAQSEIVSYAYAVANLAKEVFPKSMELILNVD